MVFWVICFFTTLSCSPMKLVRAVHTTVRRLYLRLQVTWNNHHIDIRQRFMGRLPHFEAGLSCDSVCIFRCHFNVHYHWKEGRWQEIQHPFEPHFIPHSP